MPMLTHEQLKSMNIDWNEVMRNTDVARSLAQTNLRILKGRDPSTDEYKFTWMTGMAELLNIPHAYSDDPSYGTW